MFSLLMQLLMQDGKPTNWAVVDPDKSVASTAALQIVSLIF